MKIKSISKEKIDSPAFEDVREWYEKHLHPDANTYDDQSVYEKVYHNGGWAGIFQCIEENQLITLSNGIKKPIKNIKINDEVITYDLKTNSFINETVINVFNHGLKNCIELTFDNNTKLVCTEDHLIYTQRGWVRADSIKDDDTVVCFNEHDNYVT